MTDLFVCSNLTVHYDTRSALRDVNLHIRGGEITALLGPNGAGKSTLLKVMSGMISPSQGSVQFAGKPLDGPHSSITYVPQRSDVDWKFPISVLECTLLGLVRRRSRWRPFSTRDRDLAMQSLRSVRMDHLARAQIDALSGGQQQRVFLARALMNESEALLLDEPFTGVDVPTQEMLVEMFETLKHRGTAVVYATHDLAQAADTADHAVLLNGEVIADGPVRDVFTSEHLKKTFGGALIALDTLQAVAP